MIENSSNYIKDDCPCSKINCERHGNCVPCREHHYAKFKLPSCERDNIELRKQMQTKKKEKRKEWRNKQKNEKKERKCKKSL